MWGWGTETDTLQVWPRMTFLACILGEKRGGVHRGEICSAFLQANLQGHLQLLWNDMHPAPLSWK